MATAKKNNYIDLELDWLEAKANEMKAYVDARPMEGLTDRVIWKEMKGGGKMPIVASSVEQQITSHRAILADYLKITESIQKLRESEDQKKKSTPRGDAALTPVELGIV